MGWSFRLGRLWGTEIKVHVTFFILLAYQAVNGYTSGALPGAARESIALLALFGCVVMHEFGHIRMAARFGIQTPDVILLPIGGLARLARMPDEPRQELLIALAGPAVNLVIAGLLFAFFALRGDLASLHLGLESPPPLLPYLLVANVVLLVFNLIPAFPMDGGRVLRAILASRLGIQRATRIASTVGQGLAVIGGLWALASGATFLVLIALFVFLGAGSEAAAVETRLAGRGLTVERMMVTHFRTIPIHARLAQAVEMLLDGEQREFPVVDNDGRLEGLLTREHLIKGLSARGPESVVGEAMAVPVPTVPSGTPFEAALGQLRASGLPALPVVGPGGELMGLLTLDNISDLLLVRKAVGR
jgi:stage IV sporulation protein FB